MVPFESHLTLIVASYSSLEALISQEPHGDTDHAQSPSQGTNS